MWYLLDSLPQKEIFYRFMSIPEDICLLNFVQDCRSKNLEQHAYRIETRIFSKNFHRIYQIMETFTLFMQVVQKFCKWRRIPSSLQLMFENVFITTHSVFLLPQGMFPRLPWGMLWGKAWAIVLERLGECSGECLGNCFGECLEEQFRECLGECLAERLRNTSLHLP